MRWQPPSQSHCLFVQTPSTRDCSTLFVGKHQSATPNHSKINNVVTITNKYICKFQTTFFFFCFTVQYMKNRGRVSPYNSGLTCTCSKKLIIKKSICFITFYCHATPFLCPQLLDTLARITTLDLNWRTLPSIPHQTLANFLLECVLTMFFLLTIDMRSN